MDGSRRLLVWLLVAAVLCAVYVSGTSFGLALDLRPGAPFGQTLGIVAAVMLLATLYYFPLRRSENSRWPKPAAQALHGLTGTLGAALAIMHSRAELREWSTLVLLAVLGLLATGVYGRVVAPLRLGSAFGRGAIPYAPASQVPPASSGPQAFVEAKRGLLKSIAPNVRESEFVVRWHHWTRHPLLTWRYHRLAMAERRALRQDPHSAADEIPLAERYWRRLHLILAVLFVVGLVAHVVTTVFFAGYVAKGREIYWWHLTQW